MQFGRPPLLAGREINNLCYYCSRFINTPVITLYYIPKLSIARRDIFDAIIATFHTYYKYCAYRPDVLYPGIMG